MLGRLPAPHRRRGRSIRRPGLGLLIAIPATRNLPTAPWCTCLRGAPTGTVITLFRAGGWRRRPEQQDQAELGRLLTAAAGYRVLARDGTHLGWLDHIRYERHADRPTRSSSAVAVSSPGGGVSLPSARCPKSDHVTGRLWCAAPARSDPRTPYRRAGVPQQKERGVLPGSCGLLGGSFAQLRRNEMAFRHPRGQRHARGLGERCRAIAARWGIELSDADA